MAHKVRCDISFQDMDEYLTMKGYLDGAGLKFDSFASYSINYVWNLMLEQYAEQLKKEQADAIKSAGAESGGNTEEVSLFEGAAAEAPSDGQTDYAKEG